MAQQQQVAPGGHYSGHNPIPTVKQFIENLDKDKKERDRQIDEQGGAGKQNGQNATTAQGVQPHKMQKRKVDGTEKTVTDPTTGNQVTISDVDKSMMSEVDNPHLVVPNANLQKDTVSIAIRMPHELHMLTSPSPSRQTPTSRSRTTNTTKMLQHHLIPLLKAPLQMFRSTAKRPTCSSTPHRLSATSRLSLPWRSGLAIFALEYLLPRSLSEKCSAALSKVSYHWPCACHLECGYG